MDSGQHIRIQFTEDMDRLLDSMRQFVEHFELVFDVDWEMTQTLIQNSERMISQEGTFIRPMVDDESNDWCNRGGLLACYRDLVKRMEALGIEREHWNDIGQNPTEE